MNNKKENNKFAIGDTVSFGVDICKVVDIIDYKNGYTYDICIFNDDGMYLNVPEEKLEIIS